MQQNILASVQALGIAAAASRVGNDGMSIDWVAEGTPEHKLECLNTTFSQGGLVHEKKVYSQTGEDGIIEAIFRCIGDRDKCVHTLSCTALSALELDHCHGLSRSQSTV